MVKVRVCVDVQYAMLYHQHYLFGKMLFNFSLHCIRVSCFFQVAGLRMETRGWKIPRLIPRLLSYSGISCLF